MIKDKKFLPVYTRESILNSEIKSGIFIVFSGPNSGVYKASFVRRSSSTIWIFSFRKSYFSGELISFKLKDYLFFPSKGLKFHKTLTCKKLYNDI